MSGGGAPDGEAAPPALPSSTDAVVIGAGIAGLAAAGELVAAGRRVVMLEKSRGIGGRMATRRVGDAVCDHGAQFFTVRGREFDAIVRDAAAAGAVATWCDGFARAVGGDGRTTPAADGHPRWRGVHGMTDLPKLLAGRLAATGDRFRLATLVAATAVARAAAGVRIAIAAEGGVTAGIDAAGVVLTAPVPQSLALFAAGGMLEGASPAVDPEPRRALDGVGYDPCFALMLVLAEPSRVPPPGGIQFEPGGPLAWIADNFQKGTSPVPAHTVHAAGAFSREHFDRPADEVAAALLHHAAPWIAGAPATAVVARSLHRWKFALPTTVLPEPFVVAAASPPVVCCGDAFAWPRVEGAATSGAAAGRWLAARLAAP